MSKDLNKCMFIGRLGRDPEVRYLPDGKAVATIVLACGDDYKDKNTGQKVEQTNWIRIVAFGRLAEIIGEYCNKGSRLYIEGKWTCRKWQDQAGQDQYTTEVVAGNMQLLDSPQGNGQQQGQQRAPQQNRQPAPQQGGQAPMANSGGFDDFDDDGTPF